MTVKIVETTISILVRVFIDSIINRKQIKRKSTPGAGIPPSFSFQSINEKEKDCFEPACQSNRRKIT